MFVFDYKILWFNFVFRFLFVFVRLNGVEEMGKNVYEGIVFLFIGCCLVNDLVCFCVNVVCGDFLFLLIFLLVMIIIFGLSSVVSGMCILFVELLV